MRPIHYLLCIAIACIPFLSSVDAGNPNYLQNSLLGRPTAAFLRHQNHQTFANSLLKASASGPRQFNSYGRSTFRTQRSMVLDFWDPLEPLEFAWEMYCNRYEILDELVAKLLVISKRNSVRALVLGGSALVVGEILARLGVIGEPRQGLAAKVKKSRQFSEGTKERAYQKVGTVLVERGLKTFRRLGGRSKFAISVSAGALFGQGAIKITTFCVRATLISFFVIETMSFLGIIGETGESILDWVEDQQEHHADWTQHVAAGHKNLRRKLSFEWLEDLYKATVDEEKIASFGFSVGTIFALVT